MKQKAIDLIELKLNGAKNYEDVNPFSDRITKKDKKENEERVKIYQYILDILKEENYEK